MARTPAKQTANKPRLNNPQNRRKAKPVRCRQTHNSVLILLNKPCGILSQFSGSDRNLSELISIPDVYPAGRLDKDSEGLLLLTNNGALQHRIAHPRHKLNKSYWVQIEGQPDVSAVRRLTGNQLLLKDGPAKALSAAIVNEPADLWPRTPAIRSRKSIPTSWLDLSINEGRNRQVRRMTAAIGFPTLRLIRHRIGPWTISDIQSGKYQTITLNSADIRTLLSS